MTAPVATHTFQHVVDDVRRRFGDEDNIQITVDDIRRWTNSAQEEINSKDPMIQAVETITTDGTEVSFSLPDDLMQIDTVVWRPDTSTVYRTLTATDMTQGLQDSMSVGPTGDAISWYVWANQIYLVPSPTSAGSMSIYYIAKPVAVTNLSDTLGIPDRYYKELVSFVMAQTYELDQDWQGHTAQTQAFSQGMTEKMLTNRVTTGAYPTIRDVDDEDFFWIP